MPSFGGSFLGAGGVGGPFNNANKMELMNMIDQQKDMASSARTRGMAHQTTF